MQNTRPSRKRAGTSTNGVPQDPAQRARCDDTAMPKPHSDSHDSQGYGQHQSAIPHASLSMRPKYSSTYQPDNLATPPTPHSSPELHPAQIRHTAVDDELVIGPQSRTVSCTYTRNEFPFPIQPVPGKVRNKALEIMIPEEVDDIDIQMPTGESTRTQRDALAIPRSDPTSSTQYSHSPTCASMIPATPVSAGPSSSLPSLASSQLYSPTSPTAPPTPTSRFNSAVNTLKLVLMASDLGMSVNELEELNEFASTPQPGSSKRAGRILSHRDMRQRPDSGFDVAKHGSTHGRRDCKVGNCGQHASPEDMWKDINWSSSFSDTSDDEMTENIERGPLDPEDSGEEMSSAKQCWQRTVHGNIPSVVSIPEGNAIVGKAKVARLTRPAALYMKTSIETVEPAVGSHGETMWLSDL